MRPSETAALGTGTHGGTRRPPPGTEGTREPAAGGRLEAGLAVQTKPLTPAPHRLLAATDLARAHPVNVSRSHGEWPCRSREPAQARLDEPVHADTVPKGLVIGVGPNDPILIAAPLGLSVRVTLAAQFDAVGSLALLGYVGRAAFIQRVNKTAT